MGIRRSSHGNMRPLRRIPFNLQQLQHQIDKEKEQSESEKKESSHAK